MEGKACLYIHVFSWFLKVPSEGAAQISGGRLFQSRGATAEKAQFLVLYFRASLGVRLLSLTSWLAWVTQVELVGSKRSKSVTKLIFLIFLLQLHLKCQIVEVFYNSNTN